MTPAKALSPRDQEALREADRELTEGKTHRLDDVQHALGLPTE